MRTVLALIVFISLTATAHANDGDFKEVAEMCITGAFELNAGSGDEPEPEPETDKTDKSDKTDKAGKPEKKARVGMCIGLATRCGLLPKGVCFTQSGCMNPYMGDRCDGTARQCTQFNTKNSCHMQRGCTWAN